MKYSERKRLVITQPVGLSNNQLSQLGDLCKVTAYDSICKSTAEWLERVKGADIIYTNSHGFDDGWRYLKDVYVTYPFVTKSFLDLDILRKHNVLASNSPGCNQIAVTEWIVAMLIDYARRLSDYRNTREITSPIPPSTSSIFGKSVCIIGKGAIGNRAGQALKALGMEVVFYTRHDNLKAKLHHADYIVNCLSLNESTEGFYNKDLFGLVEPGAVLISISPNGTVNSTDLLQSLEQGQVAHFITDNASSLIFDVEDKDYLLFLDHPAITITPHVAAYSDVTLQTANAMCLENITAYLAGKPIRLVSDS